MKRSLLLLGSTVALLLAWQKAGAAPLDAETCGKLNGERVQLEFAGAGTNMSKGPDWAKANLSADAVKQVLRLIEVEAQLLFRCTGPNLVNLPTEADPDPAADTAKADGSDPAKGEAASAKAKPKPDAGKKAAAVPPKAKDGKAEVPAAKAKKGPDSKAAAPSDAKKAPAKPAKQQPGQAPAEKAAAAKAGDKGKGKGKADDAYKPSPADPKANPFAGQAPPSAK